MLQLTLDSGATRPVEAFIFDSDGTLVDSEVPSMDVLHAEARAMGVDFTREQAHQLFRGVRMADCVAWVAAQLGCDASSFADTFTTRVRAAQALCFAQGLQAMPGAFELLEALRIPFSVATNGPREKVELTLGLTGLRRFFGDHVYSAYELGSYKPDPGMFLHAAGAMGVAASACCVVEDSLPGVHAGLAAGMQVATLLPASSLPAGLADQLLCIGDLHALRARLSA